MKKDEVLKCLEEGKVIYYDSEYCYPGTTQQKEWRWSNAKLRIQTMKVGNQPPKLVDVWKEPDLWNEIFELLEQGYILVAHNAIADIRPDLCDDRILKYIINGQVHDTIYLERLIHGMTDPIGEWSSQRDIEVEDEDEEDEEEDPFTKKRSKKFALDAVVFRHTGVVIKKTYQDARTWLKKELSSKALEYALNDIKYLPKIYQNQINSVNKLNIWDIVELNHQLLTTSYLIMKYGIPIDILKLKEHRKNYTNKAKELEQKLLQVLPKVSYTDCQLIEEYFKFFWQRGKGLGGLTNKSKAMQLVKRRENHSVTTHCWRWVTDNKDKIVHYVNLNSAQQKLEAFQRLGYQVKDTKEATIKEYLSNNECPILESYLTWQKCNSLLKKILEKIDYGMYLRKDNSIKSTFTWVRALNGRSSASDMNVQQLPRELKDIYGSPPGMVKVEYDYSAIELMKMLNDYPVPELTRLVLDDQEDIHVFNAARFFNQDYQSLLKRYRNGDKEAKVMRNAAKTVIYFLQYKSPKRPEDRFVTGTAKLMEIFKADLGWDLPREQSEYLICTGEDIIKPWTSEKLLIDGDIGRLAKGQSNLQSELLSFLKMNPADMEMALENGIVFFKGAKGMFYKFDLLRDNIYTPEKEEYNEDTGEWKLKREYINSRSLYSCRLAGPIAIAAKSAVNNIQKCLIERFGAENARLGLFVHDSVTCYCKPEIAKEVEKILCENMLKEMYEVAEFSTLPVYIEGAIQGQEEKKVGYNGKEIVGL